MAAGDLDRAVDADAHYHDEAVVAFTNSEHRVQVAVIDYNANDSHLLATFPNTDLPVIGAEKDGKWFPGSIGVAVGDFDGGPFNQIALTWQDGTGRIHLTLLRYQESRAYVRTLDVIGSPDGTTLFADEKATNSLTSGYAETVAGEFDRDGHADVAIAYAAANPGTTQLSGHLGVVSFTSDFKVRGQTSAQFSVEAQLLPKGRDGDTWTPHGIKLVSGLFKFDPQQGFSFHRRELALAWSESPPRGFADYFAIYDVDPASDCTDDTCSLSITPQVKPSYLRQTVEQTGDDLPLSLAVGGFAGLGKGGEPPLWGLAVALPPIAHVQGELDLYDVATGERAVVESLTGQYVLTAYDREGTSLALGAPLVFTVTNLVRPTLIAAQPPAHADWLDGHFVNVSRTGHFAVQMGNAQTTEYKFDSSAKAGSDVGVTAATSGKISYKAGAGDFAGVSGSIEVKAKFAANWSDTSRQWNKYSTKIATQVTSTSSDDDIVQGEYVTYYVYRYPILGPPQTRIDVEKCKDCLPFYEVTIPGQVIPVNDAGRALGWYQPSWQNGDALSYPKLNGSGTVEIPDLGSYHYTGTDGKDVDVREPLLNQVNSVAGKETTASLTLTKQTGQGGSTTGSSSWEGSIEVKVSAQIKAGFGPLGTSLAGSFSAGVNGGKSFTHTTTGQSSSSSADSFLLTIPAIDSNKAYRVATAYYYDSAGVPKVIHGVDLTSSFGSSEWWRRNYGQAPDPALSLPNATYLTYDAVHELIVPRFNTLASRQLIRGFSALQPEDPSSPVTSGQPYATDPNVGDKVTFAVQLHDFSLVDSPAVPVEFYAVPVDATGLNVTGAAELIGKVRSLAIPSQGMVTVKAPSWTAKANGNGAQSWRIFVVVDPDNSVDEIHPWKNKDGTTCPKDALDPDPAPGTVVDGKMVDPMTGKPETLACAQNNQGYGTITVMPTRATSRQRPAPPAFTASVGVFHAARQGSGVPQDAAARLSGMGLVDGNARNLRLAAGGGVPSIPLGRAVTGLIYTRARASTGAIQPVLVYDGPPAAGHLIAATTANGATTAQGGDARFDWWPLTPGLHTIYVLMLGSDPASNTHETMKVNVLAR